MTRILLHVGAPKTGTTAIQGYLAGHEEKLRGLGVNYTRTQRPHIAHNTIPKLLQKGQGAAYMSALKAEIESSDAQVHVISSEMLFRLPMARLTAQQFATHFPANLSSKTRVVCYLRRHDRFIEALYKQFVKNGKIDPNPQAFALHQMEILNFVDVLQAYADVFGSENVIVRPFERSAFPGQDVVRDFISLLGVPGLEALHTAAENQINPTLSCEISEILGQVRLHTGLNNRQMIRDITAMNIPAAFSSNDVFDRSTQTRIIEHFEADDAGLCAWTGRKKGPFFDRSDQEGLAVPGTVSDQGWPDLGEAGRWRAASSIVVKALAKQVKQR